MAHLQRTYPTSMSKGRASFPKGFLFGTASSSYQVLHIRIYCRVKSLLGETSTVDYRDESTITVNGKDGRVGKSFTFNKVFPSTASQEAVFAQTKPLIQCVLDGYNVCILAYGQTGSGKTYTIMGTEPDKMGELHAKSGLNYRALTELFNLSSKRKETFSYSVSVQMLEIYNEKLRDLLAPTGQTKELKIRDTSSDGHKVEGATWVQVYSVSDVISLMRDGLRKRATSSTAMNHLSSRSHCCLSVLVKGRNLSLGAIQTGILYMVDLAGSENPVKADTIGDKDRMKETVSINKSFGSFQGQGVLEALSKKHDHIPYVVFLNKTLF